MNPMIKAVLFDMDGVIVNTEPLHKKAYFKALEELNLKFSTEYYEQFTGKAAMEICRTICHDFDLSILPKDLLSLKRKYFQLFFEQDDLVLIDGVLELIKDYHQNGLTLILASSASMVNIERIFHRFDLNQFFTAKISGAALKASKPHPEIFIRAAELARTPIEKCIVIEDSTNGMKAAKAAGIFCIGFKSPASNQDFSIADKTITDFKEIGFDRLKEIFL